MFGQTHRKPLQKKGDSVHPLSFFNNDFCIVIGWWKPFIGYEVMAGWQHPWFNVFFSRQTLKLQPGLSHRIEDEATLIDEVPRGSLSAKFDINCSWREIYLHRKRLVYSTVEHDWDMWLDFKCDLIISNIYLYLFGYVNVKPTSLLNGWDLNCFRAWQSPGSIWRGKCVLLLIVLLEEISYRLTSSSSHNLTCKFQAFRTLSVFSKYRHQMPSIGSINCY